MTCTFGQHSIHSTGTRVPVRVLYGSAQIPVLVGTGSWIPGRHLGAMELADTVLQTPNSNRSGPLTVGMGQSQELLGRAHRPPKA